MSQADALRPETADTSVSERPRFSEAPMKTQSFSEHDSAEKHESQVNGHENEVENEVEKSPKKSFIDKLPGWVGFHLRNPGSWKVLARCWLGSWIAVVVLLPQASLDVLGNTYVATHLRWKIFAEAFAVRSSPS